MRYPSTADKGFQDTQMLEWSDLTTLTLLTRRLAGRETCRHMGKQQICERIQRVLMLHVNVC